MEGGYGGLPRPPSGGPLLNFDIESGNSMGLDFCVMGRALCLLLIGCRCFLGFEFIIELSKSLNVTGVLGEVGWAGVGGRWKNRLSGIYVLKEQQTKMEDMNMPLARGSTNYEFHVQMYGCTVGMTYVHCRIAGPGSNRLMNATDYRSHFGSKYKLG